MGRLLDQNAFPTGTLHGLAAVVQQVGKGQQVGKVRQVENVQPVGQPVVAEGVSHRPADPSQTIPPVKNIPVRVSVFFCSFRDGPPFP